MDIPAKLQVWCWPWHLGAPHWAGATDPHLAGRDWLQLRNDGHPPHRCTKQNAIWKDWLHTYSKWLPWAGQEAPRLNCRIIQNQFWQIFCGSEDACARAVSRPNLVLISIWNHSWAIVAEERIRDHVCSPWGTRRSEQVNSSLRHAVHPEGLQ